MSIYPVEDLKIIKELLDEGIISFEEFTFLKKKILSLSSNNYEFIDKYDQLVRGTNYKEGINNRTTSNKDCIIALNNAKNLMYHDKSKSNVIVFSKAVLDLVNNKESIITYFKRDSISDPYIVFDNGMNYYAISSTTNTYDNQQQCNVLKIDINFILKALFENKSIAGIVIDPFQSVRLFLSKDMILKMLIHGTYENQNFGTGAHKSWGPGIPFYTEKDLMTEGELLNFAIQVVRDFEFKGRESDIISLSDNTESLVNIIVKKDEEYSFITVKGYCNNEDVDLELVKKLRLKALGEKYNAHCFYASVCFRSSDRDRFEKCIALKGDSFYSKYTGLKSV